MSAPLVSVVMSVFDGERFLAEAVESILAQTFVDFEFLIIDDGSRDGTAQMLAAYAGRDSRVRILSQENRGLVAALNRGIATAAGRYIARMDADDVSKPWRFEQQVAFLEAHPEMAMVGGAVAFMNAEGKFLRENANPTEDAEIRAALVDDCPFWHPTVLIRKDVLEATGGYRGVVLDAEDNDLWLRIAERYTVANLSSVVLSYRLHANQVTVTKCRRMALSALAARASARLRRSGQADPLDHLQAITPEALVAMGVSLAAQEAALAERYLYFIRNMTHTGEHGVAQQALLEMLNSSDWKHAGRRVMADLRLLAAELYWQQGEFAKSAVQTGHALKMRPVSVGRPLKWLARKLGEGSAVRTPNSAL